MPLAVMPFHICLYRRTRQSPYGRLRNGVPDAQKSCGKSLLSAVLMLIIHFHPSFAKANDAPGEAGEICRTIYNNYFCGICRGFQTVLSGNRIICIAYKAFQKIYSPADIKCPPDCMKCGRCRTIPISETPKGFPTRVFRVGKQQCGSARLTAPRARRLRRRRGSACRRRAGRGRGWPLPAAFRPCFAGSA